MITTLTGNNSFLLKAEQTRLTNEFTAGHGDMALEKFDGEEATYEQMREALHSLPFLSNKKLVVLRTPSANSEFVEKVETVLRDIADTTEVVIFEPKLDKRRAYYKFLKKATEFKEFNQLDEFALEKWLVQEAKNRVGSLSQSDARYLIERVGSNQQLLSNELAKLLQYNPEITRQTIELLTDKTPQSTIFELLDAAFAGKLPQAMALYDEQRQLKVEPQQILALIAWQLHVLALVKTAGERDVSAIAKESKVNPYVVQKSQKIARNISLVDLKKLVKYVLELDVKLKTQSIDFDDALRLLLIKISQ